ncbi:MAG TPA: hypothetical protein VKB76_04975, partial [Ktedonobacterales bacterium]|nr:hypothetical protein [Ktedonobacterales bacterium]
MKKALRFHDMPIGTKCLSSFIGISILFLLSGMLGIWISQAVHASWIAYLLMAIPAIITVSLGWLLTRELIQHF